MILLSCREDQNNFKHVTLGRFSQRCLIEGVGADLKADSGITREVIRDSIVFIQQDIRNCCGHEKDSQLLTEVKDTIKLINVSEDLDSERIHCDCDCLFELKLAVSRAFYDTVKKPVYFGKHKLN